MSKQCRFFLLPSDIERLLDELRSRVGLMIISSTSSVLRPIGLESPLSEYVFEANKMKVVYVNCYLVRSADVEIKMHYCPKQSRWMVSEPSDVIQFSGCDYDGSSLRIGRFYFQNDQLIGDAIWPKRDEFLQWADRIFRRTKKLLEYSKSLRAYLGKDAAMWERKGGRLKHL